MRRAFNTPTPPAGAVPRRVRGPWSLNVAGARRLTGTVAASGSGRNPREPIPSHALPVRRSVPVKSAVPMVAVAPVVRAQTVRAATEPGNATVGAPQTVPGSNAVTTAAAAPAGSVTPAPAARLKGNACLIASAIAAAKSAVTTGAECPVEHAHRARGAWRTKRAIPQDAAQIVRVASAAATVATASAGCVRPMKSVWRMGLACLCARPTVTARAVEPMDAGGHVANVPPA